MYKKDVRSSYHPISASTSKTPSKMFALTPLAIIGALVASVSAADSELLNLKSNNNGSFIQPSKIDDREF